MSAPPRASVQACRLDIERIDNGVVHLADGRYRAVLEVGSVNFGLRGDVEREAILASYAAFLNSLTFPVQVLVRVLPVDVEQYLADLETRARLHLADTPLADLARDHVAFVRRLARNRTLLERRFCLVVPAEGRAASSPSWPGAFGWLRGAGGAGITRLDPRAAGRQLTFRCDEVARQLGRCGLSVRRLDDLELAQLFHACWCPDLARVQRLRRALADYTALVVTAATPVPAAPAARRT